MEIITSTSNCGKEHHRCDNNAAATISAAFTCLTPDQLPGDSTTASCALAAEFAAYIGAHSPLDADTLFDTVQRWLLVAATEAIANYQHSATAAALAAVTTLDEAAVKAATDAPPPR